METTEQLIARLMQENEALKGEAIQPAQSATSKAPRVREGKVYAWTATVFNSDGIIQTRVNSKGKLEEIAKGFDKGSQADKWAALRLCDGASGWYAVIEHSSMPIATKLTRDEAMAVIMGRQPGKGSPVIQSKGKGGGSLGFGVKAHQTRVTFSHG